MAIGSIWHRRGTTACSSTTSERKRSREDGPCGTDPVPQHGSASAAGPRRDLRPFDPNAPGGPAPADTTHINNVWPEDGAIYACGTRLGTLWQIRGDRLLRAARVPFGTHNARPFRDGVLFNHTEGDRIVYADRHGEVRATFDLPTYPATSLLHADLPGDLARPTFGRGLTVVDDSILVGGSSPATISAYDIETGERFASVNITMDVRNAVHGLEVWPFDDPGS